MAESLWIRKNCAEATAGWLFRLSTDARLAWEMLKCHVKIAAVSQKAPNRATRLEADIAAYLWRVSVEGVEEIERAAVEAGALEIDGENWVVVDRLAFQSERTAERYLSDKPTQTSANDDKHPHTPPNPRKRRQTREASSRFAPEEDLSDKPTQTPPSLSHATGTETETVNTPPFIPPEGGGTVERKPTRSEFLFGLLPDSHQLPDVLLAIQANFRMRGEKRKTALQETSLRSLAVRLGKFPVDDVLNGLEQATASGYDGIFPKPRVRDGPSGGRLPSGGTEAMVKELLEGSEIQKGRVGG